MPAATPSPSSFAWRRLWGSPVVALVLSIVAMTPPAGARPPCLVPPIQAPVTDPFRAPSCPYCTGNRGLEYRPVAGAGVIAAAAGTVTFAGLVAGVRYVVIEHTGGYRTTYGRLAGSALRVGAVVSAGATVGSTTDRFFFGLRLAEDYLDPAPLLGIVVARPQLVPLDGTNRLPPRMSVLRCP